MNKKTAIIFGVTGLIGNLLLEELILSKEYAEIKIFVRKLIGLSQSRFNKKDGRD